MISYNDLAHNQKYLIHPFSFDNSKKAIVAYFSHIKEEETSIIKRAYFNGEDGLTWIVPFLSLVPVIPISSLEAELI